MSAGSAPLTRVAVVVRGDRAEWALAELVALAPDGLEERAAGVDVEYAMFGGTAALPPDDELRSILGDALVSVRREPVPGGWDRRWRQFLRAVTVRDGGRAVTVRPPWIAGQPPDLVIDPGTCFGAGTHATTRLCLRLLLRLAAEAQDAGRGPLADWGSGSGVLAVAAARLGWGPVVAVDVDPGAAAVVRANAAANGVEVDTATLELAGGPPPWAPTVCANLTLDLLLALAARGDRPPERLVVSGMLAARAGDVAAAFGMRERQRLEEDGWAALVLEPA